MSFKDRQILTWLGKFLHKNHSIFVMSKGISRVFRRNNILFSMPAMVINCILLVPTAKRFRIFMWWKDAGYSFPHIYGIGQWSYSKFSVICTNGYYVLIFTVFQDTGIWTSLPLLYNDEYRKHCLAHAGMYRVLCEVQMIYNTQFTILYICMYIWTF